MTRHQRLTFALRDLAARREAPPCHGDPRFTSDKSKEREAVMPVCEACPIRDVCSAAGEAETSGVWGGTDRHIRLKPMWRHRRRIKIRKATP